MVPNGHKWIAMASCVALLFGCGSSSGGGGSGGSASTAITPTTPGGTTPGSTIPVTSVSMVSGTFNLTNGVGYHTATVLGNGMVFVAGGVGPAGTAVGTTSLVEAGAVAPGPSLITPRFNHTATLLGNGMVLIAGGQTTLTAGTASLDTTELYDPATNSISQGPTMTAFRAGQVAVEFGPIGAQEVLFAGGQDGYSILGTAEVYNVTTNIFTPLVHPLNTARTGAGGALMDDGTIVIAGGTGSAGAGPAGAEIFNPTTSTFKATTMSIPAAGGAFVGNGTEAIVAGGQIASAQYVQSTEIYEMSSQVFSSGPLLSAERRDASASWVNGAQTVVIGGRNASGAVGNIDVFSGPTMAGSTVSQGAPLQTPRYGHTASVLPGGQILVIGGFDGAGVPVAAVEIVTVAGVQTPATTTPTAPTAGIPMSITPVPSTEAIPSSATNSSSSVINSLIGGLIGSLLGTGTTQNSGLTPSIASISPNNGSAGTMVVIQATGIGAYLSVSFDNGSGSNIFCDSTDCTAYQNGSSVQVEIVIPSTLAPGTYNIDLVTSSYATAGSPNAMAQVAFTVN
jgi:hypothetical protein